jgi:hypothetical protein
MIEPELYRESQPTVGFWGLCLLQTIRLRPQLKIGHFRPRRHHPSYRRHSVGILSTRSILAVVLLNPVDVLYADIFWLILLCGVSLTVGILQTPGNSIEGWLARGTEPGIGTRSRVLFFRNV